MDRVHDLGCLLDERERGTNWGFLLTFANANVRCLTKPLAHFLNMLGKRRECRARFFVRQRHYGGPNVLQAAEIKTNAATRRNTKLVRELAPNSLSVEKSWEASEHAGIHHLAP